MRAHAQPADSAPDSRREEMENARPVRGALVRVVANRFDLPAEAITDDARFRDDLGLDSLFSIELLMALEEEFDMDIDDDAKRIKTVGDAVRYIESRVASRG